MLIQEYQLPTGQWIKSHNNYETEFVCNEIFLDTVYPINDVPLSNTAIIFDIGANIGLFSLYVKQHFPQCQLYAFEPSPEIYALLQQNMASFKKSVKALPFAMSNISNQTKPFHYYPGYSVLSGFFTDTEKDLNTILAGFGEQGQKPETQAIVKQRLQQRLTVLCETTTISDWIKHENLAVIDWIKLDVEGAELHVLQGINDADWQKIRYFSIEVHSPQLLKKICRLLKQHNFAITLSPDKKLSNANITTLHARNVYD